MTQSISPRTTQSTVIILTTDQWNDKSNANIVIPFGCFCIEIISADLKAKIKIGNGKKHYYELPYIEGEGSLDDYYTKEEVNAIINNLKYMSIAATGVYPSPSALPTAGNKLGDVRFVKNTTDPSTPIPYLWNETKWLPFSSVVDIDLSAYAKKSEVNPRLDRLESEAHTHANKDILDQVNSNVVRYAHTHANKPTLDRLTPEVIDDSHAHANKGILDLTTAPYTEEEKEKLTLLQNYEPFIGTDGSYDGDDGLVPAPSRSDAGKFLSSDGTWKDASSIIQPATTTTIGGVIVGSGLSIDQYGILSATGGGGSEVSYVAGDGISINQGSQPTDISSLTWEAGSINPTDGSDDDTTTSFIRSPHIAAGLTGSIGLSPSYNGNDVPFKIAFYDSNHNFISITESWNTSINMVDKPPGCSYTRVLLTVDESTVMDPSNLDSCVLSYPLETDKHVVTNSGVIHIELGDSSIKTIENGNTGVLITFGEDLSIDDGVLHTNIQDNITGTGESGKIAMFDGSHTITTGTVTTGSINETTCDIEDGILSFTLTPKSTVTDITLDLSND